MAVDLIRQPAAMGGWRLFDKRPVHVPQPQLRRDRRPSGIQFISTLTVQGHAIHSRALIMNKQRTDQQTEAPVTAAPEASMPGRLHLESFHDRLSDLQGHALLSLGCGGAQVGRADHLRPADQRVVWRRGLLGKHIQRCLRNRDALGLCEGPLAWPPRWGLYTCLLPLPGSACMANMTCTARLQPVCVSELSCLNISAGDRPQG